MAMTQARKDNADARIKLCPSYAAYDAARTAWEIETDPAAKRILAIARNKLVEACVDEAGILT